MKWSEIRLQYLDQWLVVEALKARTDPDGRRDLQDIVIVKECESGGAAFQAYRESHSQNPDRECYYLHTSREELDIVEERWLGVRIPLATHA